MRPDIVEAAGMALVFVDNRLRPISGTLVARTLRDEVDDLLTERGVPEDTGIGYMEFFDWLAQCSNAELSVLAMALESAEERYVALGALAVDNREACGLVIWRNM